jgi:hypothetical protein
VELIRRPDWQRRLAELVNRNRHRSWDCCALFCRDAVRQMTDVDLMPGLEVLAGRRQVARIMAAHGWRGMEDIATAFGGEPLEAQMARPGDVVSFAHDGAVFLAVRIGDGAVTSTPGGLVPVLPAAWRRAWRVG